MKCPNCNSNNTTINVYSYPHLIPIKERFEIEGTWHCFYCGRDFRPPVPKESVN